MTSVNTLNPVDPSRCPFCGHDNRCAAASDSPCWCFNTAVPGELLALLPQAQRRKACVCFACIQSFNRDPEAFVKSRGLKKR